MTEHWDTERVRARWLQLANPPAVRELEATCEAAVVALRIVDYAPGSRVPRPFASEFANPRREPYGDDHTQLGLDVDGRLVVERPFRDGQAGDADRLYTWGPHSCEVVKLGFGAELRELQVFNLDGDRLVEEIATDGWLRPDGQPAVAVTRWHYEGSRPSFAVETFECSAGGRWGWRAKRFGFVYDPDGELEQITSTISPELLGGLTGVEEAQAAAGSAEAFPAPSPMFDARPQSAPAPALATPKAPAGPAVALTPLLRSVLERYDVDPTEPGFDLAGDPGRLERVWQAIQEFAAAPVDDLYPGLRIPLPGYSDMDGLFLDINTRGPVTLTFERRIYLVDEDDEYQDSDSTGLSLHLDAELPKLRKIIEGVGGPPNNVNDGARHWITDVEHHPTWAALLRAAPEGRVTWY